MLIDKYLKKRAFPPRPLSRAVAGQGARVIGNRTHPSTRQPGPITHAVQFKEKAAGDRHPEAARRDRNAADGTVRYATERGGQAFELDRTRRGHESGRRAGAYR